MSEFNKAPAEVPPELHQTSWCADMAIEFMREEREDPWLMSVNIFDPHSPFPHACSRRVVAAEMWPRMSALGTS